ncbi:MAG: 30S ribosomal protein S8 [Alphaproteobacteria bacterium]|jgi:small subunit ribosomal protein S8|nr:30S ribosomal protein S8 [Alphaproteobacteria bacterium]|tara:strand:+ start:613 stop:1011 length:399 start_codon:yes stop_codon:yes gene_type:complete
MSLSDPLGDMLARIKNGQLRKKESVVMPASRFRGNVLDVLHREGYIRGFKKVEIENNKNEFEIELKYVDGEPVIKNISRVSTPGRRVYSKIKDLQRNFDGLGISILSTSKGVLSDNEARTEKVGGEILCKVF